MNRNLAPYDPATVARGSFKLFEEVERDREEETNREYVLVKLTAAGNEALRLLCHIQVQREIWSWKPYPFWVRTRNGGLTVTANYVSINP